MEESKVCPQCKQLKLYSEYYPNKHAANGLSSWCKACGSLYKKKNRQRILETERAYAKKNKEKVRLKNKLYRAKNRDKLLEYMVEYNKEYRPRALELMRIKYHERQKNDPIYKLIKAARDRITCCIKYAMTDKNKKSTQYLGCTWPELKEHLEKQFKDGMSWDNYGKHGWTVDHILPISLAKNDKDVVKLTNYKNLQPLWAKDNIRKGNKIL